MFAFSCKSCVSEDPTTSTVKVNVDTLAAQRQSKEDEVRSEEEKRREQERLAKEAVLQAEEALRAHEQAQAQVQKEINEAQEAEAHRASEDLARRAKEEESRRAKQAEEQRAREEEERAQRERVAAEQQRSRKEHELQAQALIEEDGRKKQVTAFLQKNGFKAVDAKKSGLMSSTYALHKAAEAGDEKMVAMLIKEGANPTQKNSAGKTAGQVAQKKNRADSHAKVLEELRGARSNTGVRGGA